MFHTWITDYEWWDTQVTSWLNSVIWVPHHVTGLAAAMMVMWVLTELLNIGFLMLTAVTFRTEDAFGFVTFCFEHKTRCV